METRTVSRRRSREVSDASFTPPTCVCLPHFEIMKEDGASAEGRLSTLLRLPSHTTITLNPETVNVLRNTEAKAQIRDFWKRAWLKTRGGGNKLFCCCFPVVNNNTERRLLSSFCPAASAEGEKNKREATSLSVAYHRIGSARLRREEEGREDG